MILRFSALHLHWIALIFAPYLLASACQNMPNDNSNQNGTENSNTTVGDRDADGIPDAQDNCPDVANPDQLDDDEDEVGNLCDNCIDDQNEDQADADGDEVGDVCDLCPDAADPDQEDTDEDGIGDVCDNCPDVANPDQEDADEDGQGDACEMEVGSISGRITALGSTGILSVLRNGRRIPAFAGSRPECAPDEILVVYDDKNISTKQKRNIQSEHGLTLMSVSPSGIHRYRCESAFAGATPQKRYLTLLHRARLVQAQPGVRLAEPNYKRHINRVPNDPLYDGNQSWHYEAINLPAAWDVTVGSEDIIVALVDTGVLLDHPDLEGRLVSGYDFISDIPTANDGDGIDDDPSDPGDSLFGNSSFHGTHTAGTVGALTDNNLGVAGVTWNCKIMPIRALGVGGGTIADIVEAMLFAGGLANASGTVPDQPAQILNLSLGGVAGEAESAIERAAIQDLVDVGLTVTAAAGNESSSQPAPPAFYPETISVGAVQATLDLANYSNFGSTVDVVAPGGDISTDTNGDGVVDGIYSTIGDDLTGTIVNDYAFFEGTSMAVPHVSGVIALMLSVNPTLTPDQVRVLLNNTTIDLGASGKDDIFGYGLIDAEAAVLAAQAGEFPDIPIISLSNTSLDFGLTENELQITISNIGGGTLNVSNVTDTEDDGGDWMSVTTSGSNPSTNVSLITVTIDRSGLEDGVYTGSILIEADDQEDKTVSVQMEVSSSFTGMIIVEALDLTSGDTIESTQTTDADNFEYTISNLPAGPYIIIAGTDIDNDGVICEEADLCGSYSGTVFVITDEVTTDIDVTVSPNGS